MNVAIVGAGAIGGLIGARLAAAGSQVSVLARGATLTALQANGLRLRNSGGEISVPVHAEQDAAALGAQDLVIIAVKSPALPDIAAQIAPLLGPDTTIMTAMNGVPWWFFESGGVPYSGVRLPALDPDGTMAQAMPVQRIVGCVVHLSSACPAPGVVQPGFGNTLILGEPGGNPHGHHSARVEALVALLTQAGFDARASADIRTDIWYKLWGNMTMNPVSALTGATCDKILDDPLVARFCLTAMQEAADIGARIGCPITQSGEERIALTRKLGAFKTSMLQDAEAGKMLEIDTLVTVMHEIGKLVGVATPSVDALLGLVRVYGQAHGVYAVR